MVNDLRYLYRFNKLQAKVFFIFIPMYRYLIKPVFFLFSPEIVHHRVIAMIKFLLNIPGLKYFISLFYKCKQPELNTVFCGIEFPNPVGLAAGFDKNAECYNELATFGFGFIEIGTVTPLPQPGNARPRLFRVVKDRALINRMGFNNHGIEKIKQRLKKSRNIIIGGNIGKNTATSNELAVNDYVSCFMSLYSYVDYFVVNVSCPNIQNLEKLQDIDKLHEILDQLVRCRKAHSLYKPILLKISPDLTQNQLDEVVNLFKTIAIDGLVVANTTRGREQLTISDEEIRKIGQGGLSGAPLKHRSTEMIRYICEQSDSKIPIMASGGIMTPADAIEKINAGATLVQVYTGFIYYGPSIVKDINLAVLHSRRLVRN